jgi:hypothetical protein
LSNICFAKQITHQNAKQMLKMISSGEFILVITKVTFLYYLIVLAKYYRREIKSLFRRLFNGIKKIAG